MIPKIPSRILSLKQDREGRPIPFFVWLNEKGEPDFRVADPAKFRVCIQFNKCWICGDQLGVYKSFLLGPVGSLTRVTTEPASHKDCAEYAISHCPFLLSPRRKRNTKDLPDGHIPTGGLTHNPGIVAHWITKKAATFNPSQNEILIRVGDPEAVFWYTEGREATFHEISDAVAEAIGRIAAEDPNNLEWAAEQYDKIRQFTPQPSRDAVPENQDSACAAEAATGSD